MNTQENNKLIAEFMEMQKTDIGWYDAEELMDLWYTTDNTFDELLFNKSLDWLMSVVKKINSSTDEWGNTNDFMIGNGYVWVDPHIGDRIFFSGNTLEALEEPMISKVYRGVLAFINHPKSK
jgi:hypothetical protein